MLVEATGRIMPEVEPQDGAATRSKQLLKAGIEVYLDTRVKSMVGGHVVLDDGTEFDADTIVWTAGRQAQPDARRHRPPAATSAAGSACSADLQVDGLPDVFSAGDCAAVPDLSKDDPKRDDQPVRAARRPAGEGAWRTT